ncbi:histidine kinase [Chitinophaga pendula]|uniref:sensor histidine kinase n=1 Tax=Chitinophaga TaxID=79328 RepID=UPI000BB0204A|nr:MULTISPECIES: histidine kinase [Chitinophaga]ASZ12734.1 sensor histidine kinase [Chitinophaga sp. MD30]UCJ09648.1 histidine kinase [Chitinophaga pendula]
MSRQFYVANNRLLTHIVFWVCYLLACTGVHADGDESFLRYLQYEAQWLPAAITVVYVNLYVLYPWLFVRKHYVAYAIVTLLLLFAGSLCSRILIEWYLEPTFFADTTHVDDIFVWYMLFKGMLWFLSPVVLFTLLLRVFRQSYEQEQHHQEMIREKLQAELNFLKAQVHPHFLFNTLNNLYSLTLTASPVAPQVVLKLSDLLSYMLYDTQSGSVPLSTEIAHIRNYIELEQLRYGHRLDVSLNISGDISGQRVAPLLLIPFVENAFKHGVSQEMDQAWITIDIKLKEGWLILKVENSHADMAEASSATLVKNGIGLQNIVRRLELLYQHAHELVLRKESGRYIADLRIKMYV